MPRIPRDLSARDLCRLLELLGYAVTRQHGSHIRLEATHPSGTHRLTVPNHDSIKIGTLNHILADVAGVTGITKSELVEQLFRD
jgi:predicted RNA binding protein YcfA (HicA-like mRNA interferase family)